jgi:hypothetical protein
LLLLLCGCLLVMSVQAASCCLDCNDACLNTATTASRLLLLVLLHGCCCCCCCACSDLTCTAAAGCSSSQCSRSTAGTAAKRKDGTIVESYWQPHVSALTVDSTTLPSYCSC